MAGMDKDYSKHTHFRCKTKWRLAHLGALGIMGERAPLKIENFTILIPLIRARFFKAGLN